MVHASLRRVSSLTGVGDRKSNLAISSATECQSESKTSERSTMGEGAQIEFSPYYRRDRHDNSTAPLPPPEVLSHLLRLRWQAKQDKDAAKIRAMDNTLRVDHGIYVYDHPPIWTRQTEPPFARWRKKAEASKMKRKEMYGPRGHPLQRVGRIAINDLDCSLSEPVIHELLSQWMVHQSRDGEDQRERAQAIRFELLLHGIRINATNLEWTTDSEYEFCEISGDDSKNGRTSAKLFREDKRLSKLRSNSEEDSKTRQRIEYLMERCLEAQLLGKREEEIFIEWELRHCYGVQRNHQNQTWFVDNPTKISVDPDDASLLQSLSAIPSYPVVELPPLTFYQDARIWNSPAYTQSASSLELGSAIASRVHFLVQERIHKREESKYLEADAIRRELWNTYVSCIGPARAKPWKNMSLTVHKNS